MGVATSVKSDSGFKRKPVVNTEQRLNTTFYIAYHGYIGRYC